MGFRKRKQQPHAVHEFVTTQRAEKDALKERERAPAAKPAKKSASKKKARTRRAK